MHSTLSRNTNHRVIAGVCAGIAQHFGWSVGWTRLGFLLLTIFSAAFPGFLVYIILWIVMPKRQKYLYDA